MAISRVPGYSLLSDLDRQGVDLKFVTDGNTLVHMDFANFYVGINGNNPSEPLTVNGNVLVNTGNVLTAANLSYDLGNTTHWWRTSYAGNVISNTVNTSNATIGNLSVAANSYVTFGNTLIHWVKDPEDPQDAATKFYVDQATGQINNFTANIPKTGNIIPLGTPVDGNLVANGAYRHWNTLTSVTDSIDDLNQVVLNVFKGTYVSDVDFTANVLAGPSALAVRFTGTYTGNPNAYYWDFGDGITSTAGNVVTHTYSNVSGGTYSVSFKAYNTNGTFSGNINAGARGSVDYADKSNYILLYTPVPIPAFTTNPTSINTTDSTTITNTSQYATGYQIYWGDGTAATPANAWATLSHTYTNSGGDATYNIILTGSSTTAGPTPVAVNSAPTTEYVYSTHTPVFSANTIRVINYQSNGGGAISFTNSTATNPGATATFVNNRYRWTWGDTTTSNVNIQSGVAGNPGTPITHTYALSAADQAAGNTAIYYARLEVLNGHTLSPFVSANTAIYVEPEVRADFTSQAVTVSDATADDALTGYVFTDYNGNDRAVFTSNNASQLATAYTWNWGDTTSDGPLSGNVAGTPVGGNITHTYTGVGAKTVYLDATGTPGTLLQTNRKTRTNYINIKANPAAPGALSTKTLSMSTASQGTGPLLAASATDNTTGNIPAAGTSITRYGSGTTLITNTITGANTSLTGTLVCYTNRTSTGSTNFSIGTNRTGTYTNLVVDDDRDAHLVISSATYPTGFYKVFNAHSAIAFSSLAYGYNDTHLSHSVTGDTNSIGFVKDNLTAVSTLNIGNVVVTQASAGTLRYISGVPYYNTGGQITVSNVAVTDFIGQTYRNISPLIIANGTLGESTSGAIISSQTRTYSQIDGAVTMLSSGIPRANVGINSTYTLGNVTINIDGSARAVGNLTLTMNNINGASTAATLPTQIQIYSLSLTGFDEMTIPVSSSLGATYTDNGKRVELGLSGDTPAYTTRDFYTGNAWTNTSTVTGTDEAIVRWGTLRHLNTINFSTGYLPVGPDLITGRSGAQYFTFAFRRAVTANFDITLSGKISGLWIAAPGTQIDSTSTLNGWIDGTTAYAGAGVPGANTAAGGNGSNGCALTNADRIPTGSVISGSSYTLTLGAENLSNATGKNCLVRIKLAAGDSITAISIGVAA